MHYRLLFLFLFVFLSPIAISQEAIFDSNNIKSPEILEDHSVTFRLYAPNTTTVEVTGNFLPRVWTDTEYGKAELPGKASLSKDENGLWSYTSAPLSPEFYDYSFLLDGVKINDPSNPFLIRDVANVTNVLLIDGDEQADLYKVNDIPHGTVTQQWYPSKLLQMNRKMTIYTPPGYEQSNENFPVLYLLHGAGGDEEAWISLGRTAQIMDNLIAQGKAKPMIVVMPNGNVIQDAAPGEGRDGYYKPEFMIPGTMEGTYETSFPEIIDFVEANYQVQADKAHRAIAGLSMGGFHSLHISRIHPNTFDYMGLFSAAILPRGELVNSIYGDFIPSLEKQRDNGYKLYWIEIGKTDFLYQANVDFRKQLDSINMPYEYHETDGGHIWKNWRIYLSEFAPKLFQ